jgi:hypothetical protein
MGIETSVVVVLRKLPSKQRVFAEENEETASPIFFVERTREGRE